MYNDYMAFELSKIKRQDAEQMAEEARLAASVAGPDPTLRIALLVVLAIAAVLLVLII